MHDKNLQAIKDLREELRQEDKPPFKLGMLLANSSYLDYHYEFIFGEDKFSTTVWRYFDRHYSSGIKFLLAKIKTENSPVIRAKIIMMLAETMDEILRNINLADEENLASKVLSVVLQYAKQGVDVEREKATIALGWLGGLPQIPLLGELMLQDDFAQVRAWAASSFMQRGFRLPAEEKEMLQKQCLVYFSQAISQESDLFAVGVMIESLGTIVGKKFRLTQKAIEEQDLEKIAKARKSALNFLQKLEN